MKILFVCAQNVGRSQTAAALFNKYFPDSHADSAGTNVEAPGETIAERAKYVEGARHILQCLKEEDIDASQFTRKPVTPDMIDGYDQIINMAEPEKTPDWLKNHQHYSYWEIEDPRFKTLEETRQTQEFIKTKVLELGGRD